MKWIDLSAYVFAAGWRERFCVAAYVGGMHFISPIHAGSLVEVKQRLFTRVNQQCTLP